jgi:hypothetical protein
MQNAIMSFRGNLKDGVSQLNWLTNANSTTSFFEIQRSIDGINFTTVGRVDARNLHNPTAEYFYRDIISEMKSASYFYRLKVRSNTGGTVYSNVLKLQAELAKNEALLYPNPARDVSQLVMSSDRNQEVKMVIYDFAGALVHSRTLNLKPGSNAFTIDTERWQSGTYLIQLVSREQTINKKLVVQSH